MLVRPNGARGYELISGERRLRAFQRLGLDEIPAVVRSMSDTESATCSSDGKVVISGPRVINLITGTSRPSLSGVVGYVTSSGVTWSY